MKRDVRVACPNGHTFDASVHRSANVTAAPHLRAEIMGGSFNITTCPVCQIESYADVPFLYHDTTVSLRVWVYPERDRHAAEEIRTKIRQAAAIVESVLPTDRKGPELLFGLEELRALIA